jgi:predicted metalloprotease with PDZ domain
MLCSSYADMERSIPQRVYGQPDRYFQDLCGSPDERLRQRCDVCERDEIVMESFSIPGGLVRVPGYKEEHGQAWFGASLLAADTGTDIPSIQEEGVYIVSVDHHTPAAYAGLLAGDCILSVDGTASHSVDDIITAVENHCPGECMMVTILRKEAVRTLEVILGNAESSSPDTSLVQADGEKTG